MIYKYNYFVVLYNYWGEHTFLYTFYFIIIFLIYIINVYTVALVEMYNLFSMNIA